MPLDPQARALVDQAPAYAKLSVETLTAAQLRANVAVAPIPVMPPVHHVEDRWIPGPGGKLRIRVYTPEGAGPFPVVMWFHGGGWCVGTIESTESPPRHLANTAKCITVSVEYRLAPEHKFPAGLEDCYAATEWVAANARSINADPKRIAVAGESAGGNFAAVVSLMARDRRGPALRYQLLVYPVIAHDFATKSHQEFGQGGYILRREMMVWYLKQYLRDERDELNPYVTPLKAPHLRGVPPAMVITAECDPLRDEGEAYAQRLKEAGVPTISICYEGMIHGFFGKPQILDKAKIAIRQASEALVAAFA